MHETTRKFEYDGPVYIRPIGRGTILEKTDQYLADEIDRLLGADGIVGWVGDVQIRIEVSGRVRPQ